MANSTDQHPWTGCERLIVFQNDHSSSFNELSERMNAFEASGFDALQRLGIAEIERVTTSPLKSANIELFKALNSSDAVAIIGGDGTVSSLLNAADTVNYQAPIALLGGGNANDIAIMANGRRTKNIEKNLGNGRARPLYPLQLTMVDALGALPRQEKLFSAYGYASIGYTAHLSALFNRSAFRQTVADKGELSRLLFEATTCLGQMGTTPQFRTTLNSGITETGELVFMNGQRMAKQMHSRESLFDQRATYTRVSNSKFLRLSGGLLRLMSGLTPKITPSNHFETVIFPLDGKPVYMEVDGEVSHSTVISKPVMLQVSTAVDGVTILAR